MTESAAAEPVPTDPPGGDAPGMEACEIAPRDPMGPPRLSMFLTDGSLARLCEAIAPSLGVRLELRDEQGKLIVPAEGDTPWQAVESPEPEGARSIDLTTRGVRIGALLVAPDGAGRDTDDDEREARVAEALAWLARAVGELADNVLELRHRVREVEALLRLTGLITRTGDIDAIIREALDMALEVLELEKGSIVLFPDVNAVTDATSNGALASESETGLTLSASRGLSRSWLESPQPLSRDRVFDRRAADGEIVVSEDVEHDDRIMIPERAASEGVRSVINAGLLVYGRSLGVLRCYGSAPRVFTPEERRLVRSIAQQTAAAIEQARLMQARERESRAQRQLQVAGAVQRRMLPASLPDLGVDIAARYQPSFDLGGDFYDAFRVGESLGVVIGDVVGKGVPAALLMSAVRATLRAHVQDLYNLDEVIGRVNTALCRDTLESEFATLWYGVLDPDSRRLTYCSAGHEPPMILRVPDHRPPTSADLDELALGGMVVGIDPSQRYHRGMCDLQAGDVFLAYTDGVTDLRNFDQKRFGKQRLVKAVLSSVADNPHASAAEIIEHVMWTLRQFAGLAPQADDMTLVVLRV